MSELTDLTATTAELEATTTRLTARRNELIRQARSNGHTWREIALAAGMTEQGVRFAIGYKRDPRNT